MQDAPRDFVLGAPRTPSVKPADGLSLSASEKPCMRLGLSSANLWHGRSLCL